MRIYNAGVTNETDQILTGRGFTTMYKQAVNTVYQNSLMEYFAYPVKLAI